MGMKPPHFESINLTLVVQTGDKIFCTSVPVCLLFMTAQVVYCPLCHRIESSAEHWH